MFWLERISSKLQISQKSTETAFCLGHQISHEFRDENRKKIVDLLVFQLERFRFGEFNAKKLVRFVGDYEITEGCDENDDGLTEKHRKLVWRNREIYRKKPMKIYNLSKNSSNCDLIRRIYMKNAMFLRKSSCFRMRFEL